MMSMFHRLAPAGAVRAKWITKIAVVFRNFVFEYMAIAEGVVGEFRQQPLFLTGVALQLGQPREDRTRIR